MNPDFLPQDSCKPDSSGLKNDAFDIFSGISAHDAIWIESVTGIDQALVRMQQIAQAHAGRYFLFDNHGAGIIARMDTAEQDESQA